MGWPFGAIQAGAQMLSVQVRAQVLFAKAAAQRPELTQPLHLWV
jgi:hypothetical protein